jgi:hypothetical protein
VGQQNDYPIHKFDPLLRDLVAWGLVTRVDKGGRWSWRLTEAAEGRLDEIIPAVDARSLEHLVHLDQLCADCGLRLRTRLRDGAYLCDSCLSLRLAERVAPPETA